MLTNYTSPILEVEVSDYKRGRTRLKQKVINRAVNILHNLDGTLTVTLPLEIYSYGVAADGSYGELLSHATRTDTLVSEATRAVDPQTGATKYRRLTATTAYNYATQQEEDLPLDARGFGDWLAYLAAKEEPLMLQPQFLAALHDTQSVNLRALREQYIRDADAAPSRFA